MVSPIEDVQDALLDLLRATEIPNVWEETIPVGSALPIENGIHLPYALVSFGGQSPAAERHQGITSSANDVKWTTVAVECVGASPRDKRTVAAIVRELLEGYSPDTGWGQLQEQLSDSYTVKAPDYDLWPVRFATGIVFTTLDNAELAIT